MPKQKMPKPPKPVRPKTSILRKIMKGLLTASLNNRLASLSYALQWYDSAIPYLLGKQLIKMSADPKNPTKEQAALNTAVKCRKLGIGATIDHEKETAFLMALRNYGKACHALKPASVDTYYDMFKNQKVQLEAKQQKIEQKFGSVITLLQKAIGSRLKLQVADAVKPVQYDSALTSLSYNRDAAKALAIKFRQEGILSVLVDQMDLITRHAALKPDGAGGWVYDSAEQLNIVGQVLENFLKFAVSADAPKRLVRKAPAPIPAAQGASKATSTGSTPKRTFAGAKGPKIGGCYAQGSCGAIFYERLSDGKEWDFVQLFMGVAHAHPVGPLKKMAKDGPAFGWTVVINGTKARLEKVAP